MGFEGRSREAIEAERQGLSPRPARAVTASDGPRGVPLAFLAYVALMIFLPLFQVECAGISVKWTGLELVTGGQGSVSGQFGDIDAESAFQLQSEEEAEGNLPQDWLVLGLPILALLAAVALLRGARPLANGLVIALITLFIVFSTVGFRLEREVNAQLSQAATQLPDGQASPELMAMSTEMATEMIEDSMSRTSWFWLGFVASIATLVAVNLEWLKSTFESRRPARPPPHQP